MEPQVGRAVAAEAVVARVARAERTRSARRGGAVAALVLEPAGPETEPEPVPRVRVAVGRTGSA